LDAINILLKIFVVVHLKIMKNTQLYVIYNL